MTANDQPAKRPPRPRGDGGLRWSESRQRWIAEITVGYTPAGKRLVRSAGDRSKTKALKKLHQKLRDRDDGLPSEAARYTIAQAVQEWLKHGLSGRDESTIETKRPLAGKHITPLLGARRLRELSADDVDEWLADRAQYVSTRTLQELRSILKRAVARAQARDKVKRNVVLLCELPKGRPGRPSKALTLDQAKAVLIAAETARPWLRAYVVLSLLVGARTEELRELTWSHVAPSTRRGNPGCPSRKPAGIMRSSPSTCGGRFVPAGTPRRQKPRRSLQLPGRGRDTPSPLVEALM